MATIYDAYDMSTDLFVSVDRRPVTGYFEVTVTRGDEMSCVQHDYLPDAASTIADAVARFADDDAPTPADALEQIVAWFNDDRLVVEDHGDGPFIVDYAEIDLAGSDRDPGMYEPMQDETED